MYVTVGKLGRNTIQVKSTVELQMVAASPEFKLLNQLHAKDPKNLTTQEHVIKSLGH
jgi:hypothetical protein